MEEESTQQPKYIRIMLYLKRRPDCSDAKFHEHWKTKHVELAMQVPTFVSKVRRYNQYHTTPALKKEAESFGVPVVDYDGIAEVWVDSIEDWKAIVTDGEFIKLVAPDEAVFIQPPIHVGIGYDNLVIGTDKRTGVETQIEGTSI